MAVAVISVAFVVTVVPGLKGVLPAGRMKGSGTRSPVPGNRAVLTKEAIRVDLPFALIS